MKRTLSLMLAATACGGEGGEVETEEELTGREAV